MKPRERTCIARVIVASMLLCFGLGGAASPAYAEPIEPETLVYKNAETAKGEPVELKLHVFKPKGWSAEDQRPVIVFFFGGGWVSGTPEQFYAHSRELAGLGMVAISAEYRVRSKHGTTPLACVEDGKSAIRFVRANAEKLGIDPARIVAAGGSAGGHVAACTGILEGFDAKDEDASISSVPNIMILFNPVIDTSPKKGYGASRVPGDDPLILSPLHRAHAKQPPSMIFHGDADTVVKIGSIRAFDKRCKTLGVVCELIEYEEASHGFFNHADFRKPKPGAPDYYASTMKHARSFLAEYGYLDAEPSKK
jgi:acetyl esterase/lipase